MFGFFFVYQEHSCDFCKFVLIGFNENSKFAGKKFCEMRNFEVLHQHKQHKNWFGSPRKHIHTLTPNWLKFVFLNPKRLENVFEWEKSFPTSTCLKRTLVPLCKRFKFFFLINSNILPVSLIPRLSIEWSERNF